MTRTIFSLLLISSFLFSCGSADYSTVTRTPRYRAGSPGSTDYLSENNFAQDTGRVVIFNATLRLSVTNADSLNHMLVALCKKYNGYAVTLGNKKSVIRVSAKNLNNTIADLSKAGKLKSKVLSGDDVTDQYKDYAIRLDNADKARLRYLELLARAENVEAALKVEKELERLNTETESLKGKLERLRHLSDFSTIDITIDEKPKLGLLGYIGKGLYAGIKWLFVRN